MLIISYYFPEGDEVDDVNEEAEENQSKYTLQFVWK